MGYFIVDFRLPAPYCLHVNMTKPYSPDQCDLSVRPQKLGPNTESTPILDLAPASKPPQQSATSGEPESGRGVPPLALTLSVPALSPCSGFLPERTQCGVEASPQGQKNRGPNVDYSMFFLLFQFASYSFTAIYNPIKPRASRGPTPGQHPKTAGQPRPPTSSHGPGRSRRKTRLASSLTSDHSSANTALQKPVCRDPKTEQSTFLFRLFSLIYTCFRFVSLSVKKNSKL